MPETKIPASTQEHLDIEDIRDDLLILKNGNVVIVLQTNAVNFDLLSEQEQDAMIFAYSQMLNSLSFPIQIMIRSKIMDISNYLLKLREAKQNQSNQSLSNQIDLYEKFIKDLVSKNNVLDKRFYVVIPFVEISLNTLNPLSTLTSKNKKVTFDKWALLERAKVGLLPKKEHLVKQLSRIGIKSKQLSTQELVELFYDIYNPSVAREQKVALSTNEYTTSIVEPAIENTFVTLPVEKPEPLPTAQQAIRQAVAKPSSPPGAQVVSSTPSVIELPKNPPVPSKPVGSNTGGTNGAV